MGQQRDMLRVRRSHRPRSYQADFGMARASAPGQELVSSKTARQLKRHNFLAGEHMKLSTRHLLIAGVALAVVVLGTTTRSHAQALGWEGETGVFVTPLAYTAASETEKVHPVVGYHYLNAGSVIGDFHEASHQGTQPEATTTSELV